MSNPTFQEWKSKNPNKSLNDYYKKFPPQKIGNNEIITNVATQQNNQSVEKSINQVLILVSVTIIIAFFLPWLDIKAFSFFDFIKCSGFDLPKLLDNIYLDFPKRTLYTIYAIPIGAFLVILGESTNSWIKIVGQISVILISIYWFYLIQQLITNSGINIDPFKIISYGIYLTLLGSVYYIVDLGKGLFD